MNSLEFGISLWVNNDGFGNKDLSSSHGTLTAVLSGRTVNFTAALTQSLQSIYSGPADPTGLIEIDIVSYQTLDTVATVSIPVTELPGYDSPMTLGASVTVPDGIYGMFMFKITNIQAVPPGGSSATSWSEYSADVSGSISAPTTQLAKPASVAASQTSRTGSGTVWSLLWGSVPQVPASAQYQYSYRTYTGGSWGAWGAAVTSESTSASVTVASTAASKIQFRVYTKSKNTSAYTDSGYAETAQYNISYNYAPTAPTTITVPTTIAGGAQISISWSASSDADGNIAGYKLERNYNNGAWTQIHQANSLSATDTIINGWVSVAYRVKAYDTDGAESTYTTSPTRTVQNNAAPTAPPSITVPLTITNGQSYSVTWSASSDADGNISGYRLERSTDGGTTYSAVYEGSALSFGDAAGAWATVKYRVRAYDDKNAISAWTTSPTRTVVTNKSPVITCDLSGDIGMKNTDFSINYTVTDGDNDPVTVTEKLDGATIRQYPAALGEEQTLTLSGVDFLKILNGNHTIIIVADDGKAVDTLALTFSKAVHALSVTLATPLSTAAAITKAVTNVARNIPAGADFTVELTNNAGDASPAWEDATTTVVNGLNFAFVNSTATNGHKFNFRITAERAPGGDGGFVASIGGAFE